MRAVVAGTVLFAVGVGNIRAPHVAQRETKRMGVALILAVMATGDGCSRTPGDERE